MGNSNQFSQQSGSKKRLPFTSREDDYSPLGQQDQLSKKLKCSLKTRIIGFAVCCAVGWLFSILGSIALVIKHSVVQFAILYSLGQVINITGSCLLATPKKQYKSMVHKSRIILSILYLGAILLTLALGIFLPQNLKGLVFISLIGQIIAYFFYTLSYIPYGKKILKKICRLMVQ